MPYASQTFLDDQVHLTDMAGKKFVANLIAVAEDNFDVQYQDIEHDKATFVMGMSIFTYGMDKLY